MSVNGSHAPVFKLKISSKGRIEFYLINILSRLFKSEQNSEEQIAELDDATIAILFPILLKLSLISRCTLESSHTSMIKTILCGEKRMKFFSKMWKKKNL